MADIKTLGGKPVAAEDTFRPIDEAVQGLVAQARAHQETHYWEPQRRQQALVEAGITRFEQDEDGVAVVEYGGEKEVPDSFDP